MKRLVIGVETFKFSDGVTYKVGKIIEQTRRCGGFGIDDNIFRTKGSRLALISFNHPECDIDSMTLFVCGYFDNRDNDTFTIPSDDFLVELRKAVKAYNAHFADKPEGTDIDIEILK